MIELDSFSKVRKIEQAGTDIASIIRQADEAELAMIKRDQERQGMDILRSVIQSRSKENPNVGIAPFIDPQVTSAAIDVAPFARDYVGLLKSFHDKNVGLLEPKAVSGGYVSMKNGKYEFTDTVDEKAKQSSLHFDETFIEKNGERQKVVRGYDSTTGKMVSEDVVKDALPTSGKESGGGSAGGSATLKSLEARKNSLQTQVAQRYPKLNLDKIISTGEVPTEEAPNRGILAETMNKLNVGSGTLRPIKLVENYLKAVADYEARAEIEGVPIDPAVNIANRKLASKVTTEVVTPAQEKPVTSKIEEVLETGADEFTIQEFREQYPQFKEKTDEDIINAYKKMGITIKP